MNSLAKAFPTPGMSSAMDQAARGFSGTFPDNISYANQVHAFHSALKNSCDAAEELELMEHLMEPVKAVKQGSSVPLSDNVPHYISKLPERCFPECSEVRKMMGLHCITYEDAQKVLVEIQEVQVKIARKAVERSVINCAMALLGEVYHMREVWNAIQKASNMVDESRVEVQKLAPLVEATLKEADAMEKALVELEPLQDVNTRTNMALIVQIKNNALHEHFAYMRSALDKLKIDVNGEQKALIYHKGEQALHGALNVANALANGFQLLTIGRSLGKWGKLVQLGITVTYAGMSVGNATMCILAGQKLQELRDQVADIDKMDVRYAEMKVVDDQLVRRLSEAMAVTLALSSKTFAPETLNDPQTLAYDRPFGYCVIL